MKKLFYLLFSLLTVTLVSCENSKEPSDPANGHEYVDLGLSVKWATCNVGANSPEESGNYFAWGETESKAEYTLKNYKWYSEEEKCFTKYYTLSEESPTGYKTTLELSDDAAHVNWGGSWRMPKSNELQELLDKCTWKWDMQNGVKGFVVTGPNGNSIFFPAAGYVVTSNLYAVGVVGSYLTSTLSAVSLNNIKILHFEPEGAAMVELNRVEANFIRPVLP